MSITRTFTRAALDTLGLPDETVTADRAVDFPELTVELHREQIDTRRWVSVNELIFRAPDDGKAYRVRYEQGLTENQEDTDPWNHAREVEAVEVEEYDRTVKAWRPVGEQPAENLPPTESRPHPPLTSNERQFLTFALDRAADTMRNEDGFTDADEAALSRLRDIAEDTAAPRILTEDEYETAYRAARYALGVHAPRIGRTTIDDAVTAALATIGVLTPQPEPEPGSCPVMFADHEGDWRQCAEPSGHDPADGHNDGEWSWPDGQTYATPDEDEQQS
ncbi:hypothetical protein ABZ690_19325 [Streptomyces sp. NPDC006967]|uniref:hypothetical protein n=1 Tax=Streptomyces sp. NPDC006967 TaxID=3156906 RepID=UPI0033FAF09D